MVGKMLITPELEAMAHRMAVRASDYEDFYMCAKDGVLQYVGVTKDGEKGFYSLIRGEWTEVEQ